METSNVQPGKAKSFFVTHKKIAVSNSKQQFASKLENAFGTGSVDEKFFKPWSSWKHSPYRRRHTKKKRWNITWEE